MPSRVLFSILGILAFSAVAGAAGPLAYDYDARVPAEWFQRLYDRVRADKISPPVASRIYGATTVALYESVRPGMREHRSLRHQLNGLTALPSIRRRQPYHWPSAANAALGRILRTLFADHGESLAAFAALEQEVRERFAFAADSRTLARSARFGRDAGTAIAEWIAADGYAERAGCPYTPPEGPGLWKPTPPGFAPAPVEPCWGELRPFVLRSGDECLTPLPPPYSADPASSLYRAALEVYEIGNGLTAEQRTIADYWSDESGGTGTAPGHWIDIVRQISLDQPLDLGRSAEAFIACWRVKYAYDLIRPVSYVQDHIDAEWMPFLVTPPFPEYDSGHSVQSRAAATVLTAMLGRGYAFTDTTHEDHGLEPALSPRRFTSFQDAATEAAISRLYGGIHYRFGVRAGLAHGRCIARKIDERIEFRRPEHD
jgi:hypothetical protein